MPEHVLAVALAFASGALLGALTLELFVDAEALGGLTRASAGLLAGATVFVLVDQALVLGAGRTGAVGLALVATVALDGLPENAALGVKLVEGPSAALLVAIALANVPEALAGSASMRAEGHSRRTTLLVWTGAAIVLVPAVLIGHVLLGGASDETVSLLLAFAGGAVLAALADTLMPEAYRHGGPFVALATAAGFLLSFVLSGET